MMLLHAYIQISVGCGGYIYYGDRLQLRRWKSLLLWNYLTSDQNIQNILQ